ncbi:hypothetical protein LCGC14_1827420, partial [marine sediment metagenome]
SNPDCDDITLPRMPSWVTSPRGEALEDVAFMSGAALGHLHLVLVRTDVPQSLLRERLALRAARLKAVTPKLRAKGAGQAVELFLTRDAVAPAALVSLNSDRAARRLCDRLVDLGAVRELTGRNTFRLYGV